MSGYNPNLRCPHCGGIHYGQRFDDCPYVRILADPNASEEQKNNAAEWLQANQPVVTSVDLVTTKAIEVSSPRTAFKLNTPGGRF